MKFSVIIPAWNEGAQIAHGLRRLREISDSAFMELIVVDGGSTDKTAELAGKWADVVEVLPAPNRGAQLHAGAKRATGDLLFFLHADAQPPGNWQERLEQNDGTAAGCQQLFLGGIGCTEHLYRAQVTHHQCERFIIAMLALPETRHRRIVRSVTSQVIAAQPLERNDFPIA